MIVLTGSIATGKSTVCSILKDNGYAIVDADKIAKELIDADIVKNLFGERYVKNGEIKRKALGDLIFSDKEEREKLNKYLHPLIKAKIDKEILEFEKKKIPYIVDIPLYFESGRYDAKIVAVVYCPKELQLKRLMERENLNKKEALKRIEAQIDIEEKRKAADFVIDNTRDIEHLEKEVKKFRMVIC